MSLFFIFVGSMLASLMFYIYSRGFLPYFDISHFTLSVLDHWNVLNILFSIFYKCSMYFCFSPGVIISSVRSARWHYQVLHDPGLSVNTHTEMGFLHMIAEVISQCCEACAYWWPLIDCLSFPAGLQLVGGTCCWHQPASHNWAVPHGWACCGAGDFRLSMLLLGVTMEISACYQFMHCASRVSLKKQYLEFGWRA